MLFGEPPRNPDDGDCLEPCRIGEKLAQMSVISGLQLVLDQHPTSSHGVLAENISPEWPDVLLLCLKLQVHADGIAEQLEVVGLREPRRKFASLVRPYIAQIDRFETAESWCGHLRLPFPETRSNGRYMMAGSRPGCNRLPPTGHRQGAGQFRRAEELGGTSGPPPCGEDRGRGGTLHNALRRPTSMPTPADQVVEQMSVSRGRREHATQHCRFQ